MRLAGSTAIVTGSDSGIGQAIAAELAVAGADVCVTYHTDENGAKETAGMVDAAGRRAVIVQVDVREEKEVERMFDRTIKTLGIPDILVNNAAVNADGTHVVDMETKAWDAVLRTNLYGPFFACRRFIRERRSAGGGGRIINVTSVHEEIPMLGAGAYDASKGGLRLLTRTLALEVAPDRITVNNIAPGMILTPMNQEALEDPEAREEQTRNIPWKRAGRPEEVAKLAVYLASTDADYVTGSSFFIDGGLRMMMGQGA
ncbi:MAG TPA: SDR family oxidoreductase [Longimicrobiales bacterium]|nr:SDR family oxidoreductase [Longimicrobiales bacterium]